MSSRRKFAAIVLGLVIWVGGAGICAGQKTKKTDEIPSAPIPVQILNAKTVFIANAGGDESRFDSPGYSGGPDRLYNEFYAAVKSWGRYELANRTGEADLIFEVQLNVLHLKRAGLQSAGEEPDYDAQFRLTVRDAKTQAVLWGITEHVEPAVLQSNRDKNFENALYWIVFELKKIAGPVAN
jgi:hypothetical protein